MAAAQFSIAVAPSSTLGGIKMVVVQPWLAASEYRRELMEILDGVSGKRIESVGYVMPSQVGWPGGHRDGQVHELEMGAELAISDGSILAFAWAMRGLDEGLAIECRAMSQKPELDAGLARIDVSVLGEWRDLIGRTIERMAVAWHVPNEGCPLMPWAFRIGFGDRGVVFALGELIDERPSYMPDELVVIFDEAFARSYSIPAGTGSAWGQVPGSH